LEETTLSDADIFLLRRGKPFSLIDEGLKTEWTIHPFAWQLKEGAKPITFDWEHTEYHFAKPEELETMDHVPQLEVGMKRVLVSDETEKALAVLRDDHESGAQALALKALDLLSKAAQSKEFSGLETSREFWTSLRWRAWHLAKNGRPSMGPAIEAALFRTLEDVRTKLNISSPESIADVRLSTLKTTIESAISATIEAKKHSLEKLAKHFVEFVERDRDDSRDSIKVVTLSSSGTITQSLALLVETLVRKGLNIKITVLESRPKFEGATFVNNLLRKFKDNTAVINKLKVEIVSDASIATVVTDADYFVFGGDKVLPNGDVSNKIGSFAAATAIGSLNPAGRTVALFETDKITGSGFDAGHLKVEYNDEAELMDAWPTASVAGIKEKRMQGFQVEVKNAYFEWVPAGFIYRYISEQGILTKEDIEKLGAESEELEKRLFGDL
jgi:translation initiation factor 2B subunit (eIF-2B alpha/beta/delta family)